MLESNAATMELGEVILTLKPGLRFNHRQGKYEQWYLVEDTLRGSFFRLGQAEYIFLCALNGETNLATAVARVCAALGAKALSEQEAFAFANWLVESGLAMTDASASAVRMQSRKDRAATQAVLQRINPIAFLNQVTKSRRDPSAGKRDLWMVFFLAICSFMVSGLQLRHVPGRIRLGSHRS